MTNQTSDFSTPLTQLSRGDIAIADLPLEDEGFWRYLFERVAHPGRTSRTSRAASGAGLLLQHPFTGKVAATRRLAAASALKSGDGGTRRQAIRFMHDYEPDDAMLDAVADATDDADSEVRVEAVRLLSKYPSERTLPGLLEILATAFDIRETIASEALVEIGAPAIPGLTNLLDDDDSRIRWRAARCLSKIAAEYEEKGTLKGLLKAFHDDSPDVAWLAADGLVALGPDVSIEVLRSALGQRLSPMTSRALHHYADHATPRQTFQPLIAATRGSAVGAATLTALGQVLKDLEGAAKS